jgi:hypothetical protein
MLADLGAGAGSRWLARLGVAIAASAALGTAGVTIGCGPLYGFWFGGSSAGSCGTPPPVSPSGSASAAGDSGAGRGGCGVWACAVPELIAWPVTCGSLDPVRRHAITG